jgi:hypothetical protein
MHEKAKRIKYIRALEKFFNRNLSLLRLENFDFELYKQRIIKNFDELQKSEAVDLNSNYLMGLKRHIDSIMQFIHHGNNDIDEKKQTLLKDANLLLKDKNQSNYKKDKHKHKKFDDGY